MGIYCSRSRGLQVGREVREGGREGGRKKKVALHVVLLAHAFQSHLLILASFLPCPPSLLAFQPGNLSERKIGTFEADLIEVSSDQEKL